MTLKMVFIFDEGIEYEYEKLSLIAKNIDPKGLMIHMISNGKNPVTKEQLINGLLSSSSETDKDTLFVEIAHGGVEDGKENRKTFAATSEMSQKELTDTIVQTVGHEIAFGLFACFGGFYVKNELEKNTNIRLFFSRSSASHETSAPYNLIILEMMMNLIAKGLSIEEMLSILITTDAETYHCYIDGEKYKFSPPHKFTIEEVERVLNDATLSDTDKELIIERLTSSGKEDFSIEGIIKIVPELERDKDLMELFDEVLAQKMTAEEREEYLKKRLADKKDVLPEPRVPADYKIPKTDFNVLINYALARGQKRGLRTALAMLKKSPELVYEKNHDNITILKVALIKKDQEFAVKIMEVTVGVFDVDSVLEITRKGQTALTYCAEEGLAKVCVVLLENGADYRKTDLEGNSALKLAIENNCLEVIKILAEFIIGKIDDRKNDTKYLKSAFALTPKHEDYFKLAVLSEDVGLVRYLTRQKAPGKIQINNAIKTNNPKIMELITEFIAPQSVQEFADYALLNDKIKSVMELIKSGANILALKTELVFGGAFSDDRESLQLLYGFADSINKKITANPDKMDGNDIMEVVEVLKKNPQEKIIFDYSGSKNQPLLKTCLDLSHDKSTIETLAENLDHFNLVSKNPQKQQELLVAAIIKSVDHESVQPIAARIIYEMEKQGAEKIDPSKYLPRNILKSSKQKSAVKNIWAKVAELRVDEKKKEQVTEARPDTPPKPSVDTKDIKTRRFSGSKNEKEKT